MGTLVHLAHVAVGELRVHLGGGEVGMAQQLLDVSQRRATSQHMRREAVSQRVRRDRGAYLRLLGVALQYQPEALARETVPAAVQEEGRYPVVAQESRAAVLQVELKRLDGLLLEGKRALLGALACATNVGALWAQVQILHVQGDQFRDPHTCGVESLQHSAVSLRLWSRAPSCLLQELIDLMHGQGLWQRLADPGRVETLGRVLA